MPEGWSQDDQVQWERQWRALVGVGYSPGTGRYKQQAKASQYQTQNDVAPTLKKKLFTVQSERANVSEERK